MTATVQPTIVADALVVAYGPERMWETIPRVGVSLADAEDMVDRMLRGETGSSRHMVAMVSPAPGGFQLTTWSV